MSRDPSARLFVAVDPPLAVAGQLVGWGRSVSAGGAARREGRLRVLEEESLHLTLLFLGSRPAEEIAELGAAMAQAAAGARQCRLSLGAPIWLPPRRPRALAVEVHDPSGELGRLQGALAAELAGGERARRFRAHITVARCRGDERRGRALAQVTPELSFIAEALVLYRSWLDPSGARYEAQASCPLAPEEP